jgi:hypothetical protein
MQGGGPAGVSRDRVSDATPDLTKQVFLVLRAMQRHPERATTANS